MSETFLERIVAATRLHLAERMRATPRDTMRDGRPLRRRHVRSPRRCARRLAAPPG